MKNKKHYPPITGTTQNIKGFSLIEFLVASALSMIVLVAVSKGYFTARQLNSAADSRMSTQQDLRNAANMVVRDARMAGSFGCFSMAEGNSNQTITDNNAATSKSDVFKLENTAGNMGVVRQITFSATGFAATSDALVFLYGAEYAKDKDGKPVINGEPSVLSTCDTVVRPAGDAKADVDKEETALKAGARGNEVSVLRYTVNAYVTGSIGGQTGLFRFQLNGNTWGSPQLLVSDVTGAAFRYMYVNNCPDGEGNTETFQYSNNLNGIPAFVRIGLTGAKNPNQIYTIDAAIRGGNTCANRSLS